MEVAEPEQGKGPRLFLLRTRASHSPGLESPGLLWVKWNYPLENLKDPRRVPHKPSRSVYSRRRQNSPAERHSDVAAGQRLTARRASLARWKAGTEVGTGGPWALGSSGGCLCSESLPLSWEAQVFNYTKL